MADAADVRSGFAGGASALKVPDLAGKVALVTGASTGIGAAVATAFGAQQMKVAVHYHRSRDAAEGVAAAIRAAGGEALLVQADVQDSDAILSCVEQVERAFGAVQVLVNNAGSMVGRRSLQEQSDAFFAETANTNARPIFTFTRAVLPAMAAGGGGSVINTTSVSARTGGTPGATLYAAVKGFVSTATRGMARELAPQRVRVNAVAPGVVRTPLQDRFTPPELLESMASQIPLGRLGEPEDCVGAYLYLASSLLSGWVTGQILEVNGGQLMP